MSSVTNMLYAIADCLGMDLDFTPPETVRAGRNKTLNVLGQKHTHRVFDMGSIVMEKFCAVAVRIIGDMGAVVISEKFDNVPVTVVIVDTRKTDLQKIMADASIKTVGALKEALASGAKATLMRDHAPMAQNSQRKWACSG